ncbi:uncharacterized protein N7459_003623 [Penicillium hispanicum]|uniref:uncharacterized protein n=1 Tax=Penicillium hispanicum TaxID=1080232 RepID=UPI00253F8249|nr:uncharacterized protein N7459_003623 [Penicillium hispanicum]KAJ5587858.1 hypothetical protein N7459_003623 [Penicillium hispanicum]
MASGVATEDSKNSTRERSTKGGNQKRLSAIARPFKRKREEDDTALGSPWDETTRRKLRVEDLDLEKSYVDEIPIPDSGHSELGPRNPRWQHKGKKPLIDVDKLPEGWNAREPDLDEEDIEGQIERCEERIADNIMPHSFTHKLKMYQARRALRDKTAVGEPAGLGWPVYQRLDNLKQTQTQLENDGDKYEQLPNIKAIIEAYRSKRLDPLIGTSLKRSTRNMMVMFGPGPVPSVPAVSVNVDNRLTLLHTITLALRLPNYQYWEEFSFIYDTGSCVMSLFDQDIETLMGPFRPPDAPAVPIVSGMDITTHFNTFNVPVITVEVTMLNAKRQRQTPWTRIPAFIKPGSFVNHPTTPRCDGPFLHYLFYVATIPDRTPSLQIATSRWDINLGGGLNMKKREAPALNTIKSAMPPFGYGDLTAQNAPKGWAAIHGAKEMPKPARGVP